MLAPINAAYVLRFQSHQFLHQNENRDITTVNQITSLWNRQGSVCIVQTVIPVKGGQINTPLAYATMTYIPLAVNIANYFCGVGTDVPDSVTVVPKRRTLTAKDVGPCVLIARPDDRSQGRKPCPLLKKKLLLLTENK
jgi:hypothetical protein